MFDGTPREQRSFRNFARMAHPILSAAEARAIQRATRDVQLVMLNADPNEPCTCIMVLIMCLFSILECVPVIIAVLARMAVRADRLTHVNALLSSSANLAIVTSRMCNGLDGQKTTIAKELKAMNSLAQQKKHTNAVATNCAVSFLGHVNTNVFHQLTDRFTPKMTSCAEQLFSWIKKLPATPILIAAPRIVLVPVPALPVVARPAPVQARGRRARMQPRQAPLQQQQPQHQQAQHQQLQHQQLQHQQPQQQQPQHPQPQQQQVQQQQAQHQQPQQQQPQHQQAQHQQLQHQQPQHQQPQHPQPQQQQVQQQQVQQQQVQHQQPQQQQAQHQQPQQQQPQQQQAQQQQAQQQPPQQQPPQQQQQQVAPVQQQPQQQQQQAINAYYMARFHRLFRVRNPAPPPPPSSSGSSSLSLSSSQLSPVLSHSAPSHSPSVSRRSSGTSSDSDSDGPDGHAPRASKRSSSVVTSEVPRSSSVSASSSIKRRRMNDSFSDHTPPPQLFSNGAFSHRDISPIPSIIGQESTVASPVHTSRSSSPSSVPTARSMSPGFRRRFFENLDRMRVQFETEQAMDLDVSTARDTPFSPNGSYKGSIVDDSMEVDDTYGMLNNSVPTGTYDIRRDSQMDVDEDVVVDSDGEEFFDASNVAQNPNATFSLHHDNDSPIQSVNGTYVVDHSDNGVQNGTYVVNQNTANGTFVMDRDPLSSPNGTFMIARIPGIVTPLSRSPSVVGRRMNAIRTPSRVPSAVAQGENDETIYENAVMDESQSATSVVSANLDDWRGVLHRTFTRDGANYDSAQQAARFTGVRRGPMTPSHTRYGITNRVFHEPLPMNTTVSQTTLNDASISANGNPFVSGHPEVEQEDEEQL